MCVQILDDFHANLGSNLRDERMDEVKIRNAIHSKLLQHCHRSRKIRVIDELGLNHGTARIDVAVVKGTLCGIEIKSAKDNLSRLPSQAKIYSLIFRQMTLVFAERFENDVVQMVPTWWKLITVSEGPRGGVHLNKIRTGKLNKNIDSASIVKLLWRDEAIDLLRASGTTGSCLRESRFVLYDQLLEAFNCDVLHKSVCYKLRIRENWRSR